MRMLQITPGSGGGFYCQNCLRDLDLLAALRRAGVDVLLVPLYLPLSAGAAPESRAPVFFGAVGLYLRHRLPRLGRLLPERWWRALDARPLLRFAARRAGSTSATGLGDLTLSMLRGEAGGQAAELERLITWLRASPEQRPDLVLLSNALLLGLARRLRQALDVPVICWLQDEHVWIDALPAAEADAVGSELRARAQDVDCFLAVSADYARRMQTRLALPPERIQVQPPGVEVARYRPADVARQPPTIGYLGRLSSEEGFEQVVDAFILLRREARWQRVRLAATGGLPPDRRFLRAQVRKLAAAGLASHCDIDPLRFQNDREGFLSGLTLFSSPVPGGDAGALNVIEALAAGVPVVQPRVGAYVELLGNAGCGLLYVPQTPEALAAAWASLLADPARLADEARRSRAAAERLFSREAAARRLVACARELITRAGSQDAAGR